MLPLNLDWSAIEHSIIKCIKKAVDETGVDGVVLGLSGGVDSSTCTALAAKALGPENVTVLIMPERESTKENIDDAISVAEHLGVKYHIINITSIVESVLNLFGDSYETSDKIAKGNVKARARMITLYYYSNKMKKLVIASSDKSEYLLGYFTKWGDVAGDIYPIIHLYKTQVRKLALHLGLPEKIANKPSTPDLWPGHKASEELGADYDVIDEILYMLVDLRKTATETSKELGIPITLVESVWRRVMENEHKRKPLRTCSLPGEIL